MLLPGYLKSDCTLVGIRKKGRKPPLLAISILLEADDGALGNGGTNDLTIEPSSIVSKLITVTWKDTVVARPEIYLINKVCNRVRHELWT